MVFTKRQPLTNQVLLAVASDSPFGSAGRGAFPSLLKKTGAVLDLLVEARKSSSIGGGGMRTEIHSNANRTSAHTKQRDCEEQHEPEKFRLLTI